VMFLRRRGVEITPTAKRLLYASFVLSFLSVFLNMHFEGGVSQSDPLGYTTLEMSGYQFISFGLPGEIRTWLMPVVGLAYLACVVAAGSILLRASDARTMLPTALVMFTQAVWFSIPHMGFYFDLGSIVPALDAFGGDSFRFYFMWTAFGHAAQYLWITAYYARADERFRGFKMYFSKVFVFGNAVWAAPLMLFGPELVGGPDYESGLALCVAAAVNLHHFILDGAIWKLRNPKIAAVLFGDQKQATIASGGKESRLWTRRIAWTIAGVLCLIKIAPSIDLDRRFPNALARRDYPTAASILDRAYFYGRDSSLLRAQLANQLVRTQNPQSAVPHYWRSLEIYPQAAGYSELGLLSEKLQGVNQAIATWEQGLALFPEDFNLNLNLGVGLLKAGRADEALPYLERAVDIEPNHEQARRALAAAQARQRA
jgi:tetratricopeptide (TPR) repeat protein